MSGAGDTKAEVVVTSHQNVDFDAFAAAVAATKLYPDATIVFAGSLNPNVREFVSLQGDRLPLIPLRSLDRSQVRRLIIVDTAECDRLGELGELCRDSSIEVTVFDHHQSGIPKKPAFVRGDNWVITGDGAQATSMVHLLLERGVEISPHEATIFALGIHEDTGSLTYPRTTVRDAEMLAVCLRLGASQPLVEHYLHSPLTAEQRELFLRLVDSVETHHPAGQEVHTAVLDETVYVDGLSVIAHKLMDLLNSEVLIQAVAMEGRVFVTARSKAPVVDVGAAMEAVGGGGHAQAGSAVVKGADPREVALRVIAALDVQGGMPTAREIMSTPVRFVDAETTVAEALMAAQRFGHSGISVREGEHVAGIVARRDLDKAVRHGLGHAPVKGVMTRDVVLAPASATVEELRRIMVETGVGRLPVVADDIYEQLREGGAPLVDQVWGIATRTDVLAAYQPPSSGEEPTARQMPAPQSLAELPFLGSIFRAASALAGDYRGVFLVGGFVRDLLLGRPNADVDIAVEGDGIEFARRLAEVLGGRVRAHKKFRTAVVLLTPEELGGAPPWLAPTDEPFHIDVATTRTEFYDYPAALPQVEHASIRQDLFRRDFTINAMAVSLRGEDFGTVYDFFGGLRDLDRKVIRVLHNLSFIEDPTRIFRAVRYENRYRFRMDEQTLSLARACVEMHLVGDLSSARLRDELIAILGERDLDWSLERLFDLGVAREVHPRLATGERTLALTHEADRLTGQLELRREIERWRIRLSALARNMSHEELYVWLEKLKLRQADAQVVRTTVVAGPRVLEQLEDSDLGEWGTYQLLSRLPLESVVFTLARAEAPGGLEPPPLVRKRLWEYLEVLRHRSLTVTGKELLDLGLAEGPQVGELLEELRRLRVTGQISKAQEENAAAKRLVEERRSRPEQQQPAD